MAKYNLNKQWEVISRGAEEIIGEEDLKKKLLEGKQLRVKFGADPTAPELHLGHTVVMEKLRAFQDLGHKVIFLIGDFTAMIGDPSGMTSERPMLTKEEIEESIRGYEKQIFKILSRDNIEIVRNSSWLNKLGAEGIIKLTTHYTVARMLERNDFEARYKKGNPITITEFIYPLLQGYDSVELKADIEIGGTDQKFNLLMGRQLQKDMGQEPQAILTMPLLEGTDGVKKMSKSYGNHIGISEVPDDIYGKVMSISDELMIRYYTLLTNEDLVTVKSLHPMGAKLKLAYKMVEKYYSKEVADKTAMEWKKQHSQRGAPSEIIPIISKDYKNKLINYIQEAEVKNKLKNPLSKAELKRRIKDGAVEFDGTKIKDINFTIEKNGRGLIKYGKRKWFNIVSLDKP